MHLQEASGRAHLVKWKILPTDASQEHVNTLRHSKLDLVLMLMKAAPPDLQD